MIRTDPAWEAWNASAIPSGAVPEALLSVPMWETAGKPFLRKVRGSRSMGWGTHRGGCRGGDPYDRDPAGYGRTDPLSQWGLGRWDQPLFAPGMEL